LEKGVAVAQAAVEEARAGLAALEAQRDKMLLRAPAGGLVLERIVSVGEIIPPGTAALRIADLDRIRLTVYVPQADVGRLRLGQIVQVQVDSFPGESFEGTVRHIATEAEFTPKSLPTEEDRATLVFAVQVDMPNSEHRLKPGMPADAVIELAGAE